MSASDEFRRYILKFRSEKGKACTHTSIRDPAARLNIPDEKLDEFFQFYCKAMVNRVPLHFTEKPKPISPMRVDLDFRFRLHVVDDSIPTSSEPMKLVRQYLPSDVKRMVKAYFDILLEYLEVPYDKMVAYVLEKPSPVEYRGKMKDGVHIIFPHIVVDNAFQYLVRKHILDKANILFDPLGLTNTYEDVVDEAIIENSNWQMYGSSKPNCDTYRVTAIYKYFPEDEDSTEGSSTSYHSGVYRPHIPSVQNKNGRLEHLPLPTAAEDLQCVSLLSMRNKESKTPYYDYKQSEVEEYIRHVLPTIDDRRKSKLHGQIFGKSKNNTKNTVPDEELKLAQKLVRECISTTRAERYDDWVKVGWCLRNIDYRLLDSWIELSRVSSKYIEGECNNLWDNMRVDTLGMGTLRWWARQDNKEQYEKLMDENVLSLIDKCAGSDGGHFDIARVVHAMYKDRYRFTSRDTWYAFDDNKHRWVRTREGIKLRTILSTCICSKFLQRAMHWNEMAYRDENNRASYEEKSKKVMDIAKKLKSAGYKASVMTECKCLFTDEKFEELLDSHPHLFGFENGVYDLRMHEFRDGLPDDYISFSTGSYYAKFDEECVESKEIELFLSQVFAKPDIRRYMKDILAMCLDGGIRQEKFYVCTGSGCHALDTTIMMYDGTIKKVQDIEVGEYLMGDDNTPRIVKELFRGEDEMYTIQPIKGEPFIVNKDHILSIKFTNLVSISKRTDSYYTTNPHYRVAWFEYNKNKALAPIRKSKTLSTREEAESYRNTLNVQGMVHRGDVLDIKVSDLLQWNSWWLKKSNVTLYKSDKILFEEKTLDIDPYLLGHWLGDGHSNSVDQETLINDKHIPQNYKTASIEQRLELLAGIIDSDGHYQSNSNQYEIIQKNKKLMEDIVYLVRSLGFACYMKEINKTCTNAKNGPKTGIYYRIQIYGEGIDDIPCKLTYKCAHARTKNKNALLDGFNIQKATVDNYYGFELDGNHRYLMGDFTVTHNSNGKSKIFELLQKAIGEYYCILPVSLITQKRAASNAAQSELERTKGRRFAIMQEPGESEKLNIGLMKELTGGDRIMARGLFKEPIEFKPQFKMVLTCNELPEVPSDDGGTWRRIRVIEFKSKFVENPTLPNEHPLDIELSDKFDRWAPVFMSMLLEHHKNMDAKTVSEPMDVRIATEGYKKNNDLIGQYIEDRIEVTKDKTKRIQIQLMQTDYRGWAAQNVPKGKKVPERAQVKAYMERTFGAYPKIGGWVGLQYKAAPQQMQLVDEEEEE